MSDVNVVVLQGNLVVDPEARVTSNGTELCSFRMASNRKFKTKSGETQEDTLFIGVTCFGKTAQTADQFLSKGSSIIVEGRMKLDTWEKDGERKSKISIIANSFTFLPKSERSASRGDQGGRRQEERSQQRRPPSPPQPLTGNFDDDIPPF